MDRAIAEDGAIRAAVAERLGASRFGLWFGEGVRLGVDGDALEVGVPNGFFQGWIRDHYAGDLAEAARAVTGRSLRLDFRIDGELEPEVGGVVRPSPSLPDRPGPIVAPPTAPRPVDRPKPQGPAATANVGRPSRRLEDFVAGPSTRLALAAAEEMARSGGAGFNPLVIVGGVGLGKTHLLEGIAAAWRARRPGSKVVQVTAEAFTNDFLEAMRGGGLAGFRSRFRRADALIVDDVHFLAAKRATQDEFQHTFDALMAAGAPIAMAADQHPRKVAKLSEELATRFLGGMVVKLEAPDAATRRAIVVAKAAARGVELPDAVAAFVAEHLRASVRELEGAVHSLVAHAAMAGRRLDLALAKSALRDQIRVTSQAVGLRDVERAVCSLFEVEPEALKSDGRARALSQPRMLAMYLARKHTGAAYSEIGRHFGGRNHSTVISAEKKVLAWLRDEGRQPSLAGFEAVGDVLAALEGALGT